MLDRRKYINNTYLRDISKYKHCVFEDKENDCYISVKKYFRVKRTFLY